MSKMRILLLLTFLTFISAHKFNNKYIDVSFYTSFYMNSSDTYLDTLITEANYLFSYGEWEDNIYIRRAETIRLSQSETDLLSASSIGVVYSNFRNFLAGKWKYNINVYLFTGQAGGYEAGMADIGTVCQKRGVSVVKITDFSSTGRVLAHEIGHNLGMSHDDTRCNLLGIMAPVVSNTFSWSDCSVKVMNEITCLPIDRFFDLPILAPSIIDQCSYIRSGSVLCNWCYEGDICDEAWCEIGNTAYSNILSWVEGTPCGNEKFCFKGDCVPPSPFLQIKSTFRTIYIDNVWRTVTFDSPFDVTPTLLLSPSSLEGTVRIRNLGKSTFEIIYSPWKYMRNFTTHTTVSFFASQGLSTQQRLRAFDVMTTFPNNFGITIPRVFCSIVTYLGFDPVIHRLRNVRRNSFDIILDEEEKLVDGHNPEFVNCLSLPESITFLNGRPVYIESYEIDSVRWIRISDRLNFLASIRTYRGFDPVNILYRVNQGMYEIKLFEERSADNETYHTPEAVDVLYFL